MNDLQTALLNEVECDLFNTDPYWPKWDHSWWKLTLLMEIQQLNRVNPQTILRWAQAIDRHYLHDFPLHENELPTGCDPQHEIICFCALGTALQIVLNAGLNPWEIWPWAQEWLSRYALADGGFNCDEQAYLHSHKSSLVSTLPMLEALLLSHEKGLWCDENRVQAGIHYLLDHRLCERRSGGVIEPRWLEPLFPRFYEYDILRALHLVLRWEKHSGKKLPREAIEASYQHLLKAPQPLQPQAWFLATEHTLRENEGKWERGQPVDLFPLLSHIIETGKGQDWIQQQWREVQTLYTENQP